MQIFIDVRTYCVCVCVFYLFLLLDVQSDSNNRLIIYEKANHLCIFYIIFFKMFYREIFDIDVTLIEIS